MSNKHLFSSYLALPTLLLCYTQICRAKNCITSSCDNINISYPFRLRNDPANCGHPDPIFALECRQNQLFLHSESRKYHVESITYSNFSIRVSDPGLNSNNYSSCPTYSYLDDDLYSSYMCRYYSSNNIYITFLNCLTPVANPLYIKNPFCGNTTAFSNASTVYSYVTSKRILVSDLEESCTYDTMAQASSPWPLKTDHNYSYTEIHDILAYGFELLWYSASCTECNEGKGTCYEDTPFKERSFICMLEYYAAYLYITDSGTALRFILGVVCIFGLRVKERKRQGPNTDEILRHQTNHMPINYSFGEIKEMTQNFKAKLGRGSHGTVFRGKLRSGPFVEVEMQTNSSTSNEEFIRRASAISRIENENVVKPFGFCIEGKNRALVYEFLHCGSLDKHFFLQEGKKSPLIVGDMFKICVGIARGMQCLHAAQIFHLGIKPHDILLDEEFNPKILDSGLCSSNYHRTEAMKADKVKMGFMPPEVFYNNIGEVSCKADVYSYGMLVLEMAALLHSLNLYGGKASEIFFPSWIYDRLCEGKELEMVDGEEEKEMVRKMIVAGLWCIQIKPRDRPTMDEVVRVLDGGTKLLDMPPMPFQRAISL